MVFIYLFHIEDISIFDEVSFFVFFAFAFVLQVISSESGKYAGSAQMIHYSLDSLSKVAPPRLVLLS